MSVVEACSMLGDYTHWVYSMGVIHTNHFSTHQISSRNYCVDLCHFLHKLPRSLDGPTRQLHRCSDSVSILVLAHHNTDFVALLISNTSGQPLYGILFIVSMI